MCKQLNGAVLKSLKPKQSGPKSEKKIGRAGSWPKFFIITLGQAGARPEKSDPCRPLTSPLEYIII